MAVQTVRDKWRRFFSDPSTSRYLIYRLLSENFHRYAKQYLIAFVFMAIVAATTGLSAWIMRDIVNEIFISKDFNQVWIISLAVLAIFATKGFATYLQAIRLARVGNAIVADLQRKLYRHFMSQGADFYHDYPSSELITRISHNASAARGVMDMLITSLGRDALSLIALVSVMIFQDPIMSLIAFVIAPPAIFVVSKLVRRVKRIAKDQFVSLTQTTHTMQESAHGYRIIRTFGLQDVMAERMNHAITGVQTRANKMASLGARTSPLMETLGGIAIALVILYSGWRTIVDGQTPGEFISFLTALLLAYDPAKRLSRLQVSLESGLVGVRLMYEILDRPSRLLERDDAEDLTVTNGQVVFDNVQFSYGDEETVLRDLSLTMDGNKKTALVGPSGGGKSTIMGLVQRFYDVTGGSIEIDGTDIRQCTLASLNSHIALVTQDTILFTGTIRENIRFGRLDASDAEVEDAAKNAFAHDFIVQLPEGYDTMIGDNAATLSGGQKQRVAIARAMIKNAPIVLLDEATSALDSESEAKVQAAFDRLSEGRTTLVIAHRLSTIRNADKICVIKDGRLVEEGTHDDLNEKGGLYANLVKLQFEH
ncbi:ABC transporter ATP-binding protein [Cohaesibacter celericrescens]|uniref:ABC transporter ATP-binding protein n=1 Tax=Cohaesibacter celericrescens TaxID=2067669 RepID=A0A2N5XUK6_9HYPH|nr:ABC transporter ATP-binding protein [Cohaesibacter celericrescens]PLW78191.1 ABC transporter ATP-binding protein [Cohaesibacter celericrescens]